MASLTLLLLVDAFRPDYLREAPYLSGLAKTSAVGRLREPFGFLPRAAYFGGLSPEQFGFSNMFACDPDRSPFAGARWLPQAAFDTVKTAADARQYVDAQARVRSSPFAASYVSSLNIPVRLLPFFAATETEPAWSAKAGYRSIFHELDDRNDAWFTCAWPLSNDLGDHSDERIVQHVLASVEPRHRFAYVHLQELDGAGHQFGPEGAALRSLVRRTDDLVKQLVEGLRDRFGNVEVIAFGDHGMVSVTRSVDVRPALDATNLVPGVDYVYFLDSTMVRLWFLTARSRTPLLESLARVRGLRVVSATEKVRHRIDGCHPSNAHEIFLADPGVVIFPDFFSGPGSAMPLGMHGYDPDCADNNGIFLVSSPRVPAGEAGVVDATEIYDWTRGLLGLSEIPSHRVHERTHAPARRFTQVGDVSADACVGSQLDAILDGLEPLTSQAEAVVLTGSFGRAEGGAVRTASGVTAINDFDVLVVGGPDVSHELAAVSLELAQRSGLDFLDLAWTDGTWTDISPTMANVDLRYGSQVVRGAPEVIERMPIVAAGSIEMHDALILLLNRIGGILSGVNDAMLAGVALSDGERRYLFTQVVKALVAVGDSYLIEWRAYDASYRVRRQRFSSLAPGAGIGQDVRHAIDCAYRRKVLPDYDELPDPVGAAIDAAPLVLDTLVRVAANTTRRRLTTLQEAAAALRDVSGEWIAIDNTRLLNRPEIASLASTSNGTHSIRQSLYAALPVLLAHMRRPDSIDDLPAELTPALRFPSEPDWESARGSVVAAWLAMNH
jgi:hypothetical protein